MKHIILFALLLTFHFKSNGQGVRFENDLEWKQIQDKAKSTNKLIFVDIYATWCVPCKTMDKNVYSLESISKIIDQHFIPIKVQFDRTKDDDERTKDWYTIADSIKKTFEISTLPSFLILAADGKPLNIEVGFLDSTALVNFLQKSINPDFQYFTQFEKYKSGDYTFSKMRELAFEAKRIGLSKESKSISRDYIDNYLFKSNDSTIFKKENIEFMTFFFGNTNSKTFKFFMSNQEKINSILGINDKAQYSIRYAIAKDYLKLDSTVNDKWWNKMEKLLTNKFGQLGMEEVLGRRMMYYLDQKDSVNFGEYYCKYFKIALKRPEYNINEITWELFQTVNEKKVLEFASYVVMKYALEEWYPNNAAAYDTYANILYKIGEVDQAINWESKAVKLKKGAPDEKLYTDALEKMKRGLPTWQTKELN